MQITFPSGPGVWRCSSVCMNAMVARSRWPVAPGAKLKPWATTLLDPLGKGTCLQNCWPGEQKLLVWISEERVWGWKSSGQLRRSHPVCNSNLPVSTGEYVCLWVYGSFMHGALSHVSDEFSPPTPHLASSPHLFSQSAVTVAWPVSLCHIHLIALVISHAVLQWPVQRWGKEREG